MYRGSRRLQAADLKRRKLKKRHVLKNTLQVAERRSRDTQKEKEARLEKIAFEAPIEVWIKMLSNDQQQINLYRVNQDILRNIVD